MEENSKLFWILAVVVALLVIGGVAFWYFGGKVPFVGQKEEAAVEIEVKDGLGAKALEKTNNPLSNELPETNPFKIKTNPFK